MNCLLSRKEIRLENGKVLLKKVLVNEYGSFSSLNNSPPPVRVLSILMTHATNALFKFGRFIEIYLFQGVIRLTGFVYLFVRYFSQ